MNVNGTPIALSPVIGAQGSRMLRITVVETNGSAVTLRVEGRIAGPWVEELRTTCNVHTDPDQIQLYLELEDVSFADSVGVAFLKELRYKGVGLLHVSPFLNELFENEFSPDRS
jgi:anti-anti-sigma regulatory factor